MLEVYAQNLATTPGTALVFTQAVQTNASVTLNAAGNAIQLKTPGYYLVTFNGYGAATAATSEIGVQLVANGTAVPQAVSATTTTAATAPQALGFASVIRVEPAPISNTATIAVNATGTAGTLVNATLIVQRIQ